MGLNLSMKTCLESLPTNTKMFDLDKFAVYHQHNGIHS